MLMARVTTILALLLLLLVADPTRPLFSEEPGEVLLYSEDFEDGQAQGWSLGDGWRVEVENGNHVLVGEGHEWASYAASRWQGTWQDYRVRFRLRLLEGGINLNVRVSEEEPGGRYFIEFWQGGTGLSKQVGEAFWNGLDSDDRPHAYDQWYDVEIAAFGGRIQVDIDGGAVLDYIDPDPLVSGTIAFETHEDSEAQIDAVTVYGSPPPKASPALVGPTVATELVAGWNSVCYLGPPQPVEDALAPIMDDVQAVYRLEAGQSFGSWFPDRPEVSKIVNLGSYEALFVLMADSTTWLQETVSIHPASLDLAPGWNSICYTGQTTDAEPAAQAIADRLGAMYVLEPAQTWKRLVPGRPDVSDLTELRRSTPALLLVTAQGTATWAFATSDIEAAPGYEATILFETEIRCPWDLAIGVNGELYVADDLGRKVVRVDESGDITILATLGGPFGARGLALSPSGELFVNTVSDIFRVGSGGDLQRFVSHVDLPRLPGADAAGFSEIEFGPTGDLFAVDGYHGGIYRVAPDGSSSLLASAGAPVDLAFSPAGELFVVDRPTNQLLKVGMDGTTTLFASGEFASPGMMDPLFMAFGPSGDLYVSGFNGIFAISPQGETSELEIEGQPANDALGVAVSGALASDALGNLYVAEGPAARITKVSPDGEVTALLPGFNPSGIGVTASADVIAAESRAWPLLPSSVVRFRADGTIGQMVVIDAPLGDMAVGPNEEVLVTVGGCVLEIPADGQVKELACGLGWGGIAVSPAGEPFVTQVETGEILRILGDGSTSPFAVDFDWGDGSAPDIDFDSVGNLYLLDPGDGSVTRFDPSGHGSIFAQLGPAPLVNPSIAVTPAGEVFVVRHGDYTLWRIAADGEVSEIARRVLVDPDGIDVGPDGSVYVSRSGSIDRIRAE